MQLEPLFVLNSMNRPYYYIYSFIKRSIYSSIAWLLCTVLVLAQPDVLEDGPHKFYYPDGSVSSEGVMINGKPEGYWRNYHPNGTLSSEGFRKDHLLDSTWHFYDEDGVLERSIQYQKDKKNGLSQRYKDSLLYLQENYVNDMRQGMAYQYFLSGQVEKSIPFVDDLEEGKGYEYAQDGRILTLVVYSNGFVRRKEKMNRKDKFGLKQGLWKEFHKNGRVKREGNYKDDKENGIFREYDKDGKLLEMTKYENGLVEEGAEEAMLLDIRTKYYKNGKVHSVGGYTQDGKKQGVFKQFDQNGEVRTSFIYQQDQKIGEGVVDSKGVNQGPWKHYYKTGELRSEGNYVDGLKDGDWVFYHKSGEVEQKGKYRQNEANGRWVWYYEDGTMHREEHYRRGEEDGHSVEYDRNGEVITEGEYIDGLREGAWFYKVGDHQEEGAYVAGNKQGDWLHTYDNGKKQFEGEYQDGLEKGKHKYYYRNGQTMWEGKYSLGLKQGDWKKYSEVGELVIIIKFKNGVEVKYDGTKLKPALEYSDGP